MEIRLVLLYFGILLISQRCTASKEERAVSKRDQDVCLYHGVTYEIGAYPIIGNCIECQCRMTADGPKVICINMCEFGRRKKSLEDENSCQYDGHTYTMGSYFHAADYNGCRQCKCEGGINGPRVVCVDLCLLGKRKRSANGMKLPRMIQRQRRYDTPPPFTTAPHTTTPSPPPYTTRIPPSPPTTIGPGQPQSHNHGHVTHHSTRSPPPPDVYHQGFG